MKSFLLQLAVVAAIFTFSIGVGVLVTQESGRVSLHPEQVSQTTGISELTWSPDGKSIAYISTQSGTPEIWVIQLTGGQARKVTSSGVLKRQPRWSPDGKWIVYVRVMTGDSGDIQLVDPKDGTTVSLTETSSDDRNPVWSPTSDEIGYTGRLGTRTQLLVVDIEQQNIRTLADVAVTDLQWSPNGKTIAYVSDPLLSNDGRRDNLDVFMIPSEGGLPKLLTPGTPRFRDYAPSWSPDSRQLVYLSESSGYSNIFIVDTVTGSRRSLLPDKADYLSPKWSPDGNTIAYVRNQDGKFELQQVAAEGGMPIGLSDRDSVNGGFENDTASPRGAFQWSPDGNRIAFTHSDPAHTSDVWVVTPDGSPPLQLTNSMPADMRREARFVWPDVLTYRSFDGTEVSGLVYKPLGGKPRTGHPALLMFRDTLDGQHAFGWDPFIQFFVSDGYVVFAPNVRGSGGYGVGYRQSVIHNGGDHDIRDAFIGLDKLSSEGLIDAERVGIYGAGTGGFLTAAALVKGEVRFKAAVCLFGIVDLTTASSYPAMAAWSRYMIGPSPMESPVPFFERSLLNFVETLRTPIIFLYAGNDGAAPFQQLQQFAVQASVKGKWFDYRVFENETSDWRNWRPYNFRQALEAMDAVFEKYLLGREREIRLSRNR